MDTARSALQVGILVVLVVALFSFGYFFFTGTAKSQLVYTVTVRFKDAGGVSPGAEVDMSGIKIGQVSSSTDGVRLDPRTNTALIDLEINRQFKIPVGSDVTVVASLLGGTASIAIFPPTRLADQPPSPVYPPGSIIQGMTGFSVSQVGDQTRQLLDQVSKTTEKADTLIETVTVTASNLNNLLNDQQLRKNLIDTTANIDQASREGVLLTQQLHQVIAVDNASAQESLANIDSTTSTISSLTQFNKQKLNQIVANLNSTTTTLNQLTQNTNRTLTQGNVAGNISDTMSNLKQATANMNGISADLHNITSDPKVQANLRETVDNLAQTTENTNKLVARMTALVGGKVRVRGSGENAFLANLDLSQNLKTNKFRTDVDLYAPISASDFVRAGIYDITESNYLNLQYGTVLPYNRALDARAGVYAGKVGAGLDYHLFRNNNLSMDLYDPNRLHLDLKARIRLSNQTALILGGEDLTRNAGVSVGVELRR